MLVKNAKCSTADRTILEQRPSLHVNPLDVFFSAAAEAPEAEAVVVIASKPAPVNHALIKP